MAETRQVTIEYTHYEPGDRFRLKNDPCRVFVCESFNAPSISSAGFVIGRNDDGYRFSFVLANVEPEPPITDAERVAALKHDKFRGLLWLSPASKWDVRWGADSFTAADIDQALDELVRRIRKEQP